MMSALYVWGSCKMRASSSPDFECGGLKNISGDILVWSPPFMSGLHVLSLSVVLYE